MKKVRFDAVRGQDVEHSAGVRRQWPIVEGQHDFMVGER